VSAGITAESESDLKNALVKARAAAGPEDLIVATGSLFLVGDIKKELGQHA
jgi:folylpolyglutamate synthase/dihydropteroate synthase